MRTFDVIVAAFEEIEFSPRPRRAVRAKKRSRHRRDRDDDDDDDGGDGRRRGLSRDHRENERPAKETRERDV